MPSGTATIHVEMSVEDLLDFMTDTYFPSRPTMTNVNVNRGARLASATIGKNEGISVWRFQFKPAGNGTTVTFDLDMPNATGLAALIVRKNVKKVPPEAVAVLKSEAEASRRAP